MTRWLLAFLLTVLFAWGPVAAALPADVRPALEAGATTTISGGAMPPSKLTALLSGAADAPAQTGAASGEAPELPADDSSAGQIWDGGDWFDPRQCFAVPPGDGPPNSACGQVGLPSPFLESPQRPPRA